MNRFLFSKVLYELLREVDADAVTSLEIGLQMSQQTGGPLSVPDGSLYQAPLRIVIETKMNAGSFTYEQLHGHLSAFKKRESGWLMLLSPAMPRMSIEPWDTLLREGTKRNVTILAVTFQQIISTLRRNLKAHNEDLEALVDDYEDFCSAQGLLPNDEWTIFVPPCGRSFDINRTYNLYFCPLEWSRRRGRYLGVYHSKSIRNLGKIAKIVHFDVSKEVVLSTDTAVSADEIKRIRNAANDFGLDGRYQFYMCDEMVDSDFKKESRGGIMGHRYLDIKSILPQYRINSLSELAASLSTKTWS